MVRPGAVLLFFFTEDRVLLNEFEIICRELEGEKVPALFSFFFLPPHTDLLYNSPKKIACVRVCVCACVRECMSA